jgi:hypothetical protein
MAKQFTREDFAQLVEKLDVARAAVFVSASALWQGDTDLELHSGRALKHVSEMLDEVCDDAAGIGAGAPGGSVTRRSPRLKGGKRAA